MSDKNCSLIKDLMPLYIEGLTSTDTNEYIKKHLSECSECNSFFEDIKLDTDINLEINNEELRDKGEIILDKIKKNQDRIKYTFIIFSMIVALSSSILSKGFIATIPLIIIVPCILKLFYDEDRVIITTSIITQLVIAVAMNDIGYMLFTLPINIFCISSGLMTSKLMKNIIEGRI
jgi:hypothetical protein